MLVPTQELVKDVMETTDIKNSLEDPEIMAAVSEIAGNPDALLKYKHNKKITDFYNHLGKLMKDGMDKQDKMANSKKQPCTSEQRQIAWKDLLSGIRMYFVNTLNKFT